MLCRALRAPHGSSTRQWPVAREGGSTGLPQPAGEAQSARPTQASPASQPAYTYRCICTYIYIYDNNDIYTHTHTHTHTNTCPCHPSTAPPMSGGEPSPGECGVA